MSMIHIKKLTPFLVFAATQVIFACFILGNELLSINNRVPGGNFPFEQSSSWIRVLIFCGGAVISFLAAWGFNSNKKSFALPSLKFTLLLATLPTLFSIGFHYWAHMGWCCEHPWSFYFGFPFSFILGIGGYDYALVKDSVNYGLFEILASSKLEIHWASNPIKLFLNILFWSNLLFVVLGLASLFHQRGKLAHEYAGRIQSENN